MSAPAKRKPERGGAGGSSTAHPLAVAIFVPGILGSCLEYGSQVLWDENGWQNLQRLAKDADFLRYDSKRPANAPRVLERVRLPFGFPGPAYYEGIIRHLSDLPFFQGARGEVRAFPYDWRESARITADKLVSFIDKYNDPPSTPTDEYRLTFVTHSMGAFCVRLAVALGKIAPENVRQIVHLAPPLRGSAKAFRTVYDQPDLPLMGLGFGLNNLDFKNYQKARRRLQDVLMTCPSMYELMPPPNSGFLHFRGRSGPVSPFDNHLGVITGEELQDYEEAHKMLQDTESQLRKASVRVDIIWGDYSGRTTHQYYWASVASRPSPSPKLTLTFRVENPVPFERGNSPGDGTVLWASSTMDGAYGEGEVGSVSGVPHELLAQDESAMKKLDLVLFTDREELS